METMFDNQNSGLNEIAACIIVVDDDPVAAGMLGATLEAAGHEVIEAASGEAVLALFAENRFPGTNRPEVIFLDIEMGAGIDGFATCRQLLAQEASKDIPVIFLSGHDDLDSRLRAYDAGGIDFVSKPFAPDEVLRKAAVSIRHYRRHQATSTENKSFLDTAMTAMTTLGESGVTLKFSRAALGCRTQYSLASQVIQSMGSFGIDCHVQIRVPTETLTLTPQGAASPLEESVFAKVVSLDRIFSFRNRMIVNYDRISILITNMPLEDEDLCGRIRDHAAMIAEAAELAVDNIQLRTEANARAEEVRALADTARQTVEDLRGRYREMLFASRHQLENMTNDIEKMYYSLGLTDRQEFTISDTVRTAVDELLALYEQGSDLDETFAGILVGLTKAGEYTVSQEDEAAPTIELW